MVELLPLPRFYHLPTVTTDRLPVTRDGIRSLTPFPFVATTLPGFPILEMQRGESPAVTGLCGLLPAHLFTSGQVRPHERTLGSRLERQRRLELADGGALGKPVLLTLPSIASLITGRYGSTEPLVTYHCGNLTYRLYSGQADGNAIKLEGLGPLAIADGHHRAYVHAALAAEGHEAFSHIPVIIAGADELSIGSFLRVIEFAGDVSSLLSALSPYFTIHAIDRPRPVTETGQWLLGYRQEYFQLTRRDQTVTDTDPGWLNTTVLPKVFDIRDTRTDPKILSVDPPYIDDGTLHYPPELHELVTLLGKPISSNSFFTEVSAGRMLPPKSTRFTPRIPSGLLVWIP